MKGQVNHSKQYRAIFQHSPMSSTEFVYMYSTTKDAATFLKVKRVLCCLNLTCLFWKWHHGLSSWRISTSISGKGVLFLSCAAADAMYQNAGMCIMDENH